MAVHKPFRAGFLLLLLGFPFPASGYESPEDVFATEESYYQFLPPPSRREVDERVAEQRRVSAQRRESEYEQLFGRNAEEEEPTHAAAPEEETEPPVAGEEGEVTEEDSLRDKLLERLLLRLEREDTLQVPPSDESLHSGAPLIGTGPETVASAFLLLGAVGWTLWRARKQEVRKIGRS